MKEYYKKVKEHIYEHRVVYSCGLTAVVVAGFTCLVMRSNGIRGVPGVDGIRGVPNNTASLIFRNKLQKLLISQTQ